MQGSVTSQADQLNRHEVSGQHGGAACDIEEGEIHDAEDGKETEGHQQVQASPPLPPITPGSILIKASPNIFIVQPKEGGNSHSH